MGLQDYYNTNDDNANGIFSDNWTAQTLITSVGYYITSLKLKLFRRGSPGTLYADIHTVDGDHKPTGSALSSGTINGNTLDENFPGVWAEISMSSYKVSPSTEYAIVLYAPDASSGDDVYWHVDNSGSTYPGRHFWSDDGGVAWTENPGRDAMFETYGTATSDYEVSGTIVGTSGGSADADVSNPNTVTATIAGVGAMTASLGKQVRLSDKQTNKTLVAVGNGEVWYEMAAGTMTELVAANGDIDTTDQLQMFSAYQKAFVINGENLKIADFVSVKLTHTALTDPHLHGDIIEQDQGSSNLAYMVVDYTNTAKTMTYGYAYYGGTSTAFDLTNSVTGDNGTTFTPTVVTDPPHWYDYTVYPGTETVSELPEEAYLGCRYRGRIVLSGNPRKPFQWYMSRVADPFDLLYVQGDAGSPVMGGNSDAGEIGDAVKALIPYHDDYLLFGCASSMWVMHGDPAAGGSLDPLSEDTGIFGANSYCWGDGGTLYFWGTNGLYKLNMPGKPVCISSMRLPQVIKDEDAKPATHRVTMAYDRRRVGIMICITKMSDGTNSNYFYDLRASDDSGIGGFFPETYPDECGAYSLFYYGANDPEYRGIVMGCKDGYIRKFDGTAADDDTGSTDTAIDSSVTFGPLSLSGVGQRSILGDVEVTLSGSSSDDVACNVFAHRTAEQIITDVDADTNIKATFTVKGSGKVRGNNLRKRVRSEFFGIQLKNSTAGESWTMERMLVNAEHSGRRL